MVQRTKFLVVVGTRPEAVKLAPVVHALRAAPWADCRVLATAQHRQLLDQTLGFFGIRPDLDLDLMRPDQSLADLTARMVSALDPVFAAERPDWVIAQGDTTTVMVAALAAFYRRIRFAHVEAGLRTGDLAQPFPEEGNRAIVGRLASLHFAPTQRAAQNLRAERVPTGAFAPAPGRRLLLVTAHRRENFGAPFEAICRALLRLAARPDVELLYPVHPNPNVRAVVGRLLAGHERIRLCDPLDYPDMVAAMRASTLILTDSGGVQEEAPSLGVPVLVLRDETERPEGVAAGAARLVGPHEERIVAAATQLLDDPAAYRAMATVQNPYGRGDSAAAIVRVLAAAR